MKEKTRNINKKEEENIIPQLVPYKYLLKRSIWTAIQIIIILVILFFFTEIFKFIRSIYGF
ncbi:MAG: hypothetical protein KGD63_02150 [Candidatus Lokiarchaeota archaeon]|nr:hypothetical protein [Candidatus Lokiarchaeota archaeon]